MEYIEVVERIQQLSGEDDRDLIENFLGYFFYEDEESEPLLPVDFEDLEGVIRAASECRFVLCDGGSLQDVATQAVREIQLETLAKIDTVMVQFIGGDSLDLPTIHSAFSAIEFSLSTDNEVDSLIAATIDPNLTTWVTALFVSWRK